MLLSIASRMIADADTVSIFPSATRFRAKSLITRNCSSGSTHDVVVINWPLSHQSNTSLPYVHNVHF